MSNTQRNGRSSGRRSARRPRRRWTSGKTPPSCGFFIPLRAAVRHLAGYAGEFPEMTSEFEPLFSLSEKMAAEILVFSSDQGQETSFWESQSIWTKQTCQYVHHNLEESGSLAEGLVPRLFSPPPDCPHGSHLPFLSRLLKPTSPSLLQEGSSLSLVGLCYLLSDLGLLIGG